MVAGLSDKDADVRLSALRVLVLHDQLREYSELIAALKHDSSEEVSHFPIPRSHPVSPHS